MKKNKKIYVLIPLFVMLFVVVLVKALNISYSASDAYYYVRRNMLSHHYIANNQSNTASGTILVKTGNRKSASDGYATVVYCAEQGVNNSSSSHTKRGLGEISDSLVSSSAKTKLNAIMPYSYPYVTLSELKNYLKDSKIGIGASTYSSYNFDNLDAQESMTAVQAAIWNAMQNTNKFVYGKTVSSISSKQSSFKAFGRINWQSCGGYNTGSGNHATILTTEEREWYNTGACNSTSNFYTYVYNVKNDGFSDERINALINWYASLSSKITSEVAVNNYSIKSYKYTEENGTLTLDVVINSLGKDYAITFYDESGNIVLDTQNVVSNEAGDSFTIKNLPFKTSIVNAVISTTTSAKNVYYYQGSGQDWIGVDTSAVPHTTNLSILNDGKGQIILYKVSESDINVSVDYDLELDESKCGNEGCLSGAYFILYASDKKTVISEFVTGKSSMTIGSLPDGIYYLYEQDSPHGYMKYNYIGDYVDKDGYIKIEIENGNTASIVVNNDLVKVCFSKIDSDTKKNLDGGKFRVEDAEGSTYEIFESSSQQNKYCMEGQLDSGYYYLVEETAPANYIKTDKIFKFAVGKFDPEDIVVELEESETVVLVETVNNLVTIENDPGVVISKSDLSTGACLAGAELVVKDSQGKVVDKWTSSCEDGKENHMLALEPGTYTLREDQTPIGYATAEEITFTIDKNGKTSTSLDMKDDPIEACFMKVTEGLEEGLMGAEFEIYKSDGTLYDTFTSDIVETCFLYMPVGEYTLKETKAPEGYKISEEEIKITVKDTGERQLFEIENELDVPKTSMDYSRVIIIIASIFMVFGFGLVSYYVVKKH
ncbi:MAG: Cys-Gln thioester bond-forming surface protein [Bacilli bacterium]|nr:Cys-Gln thioester bond-forming surface protein [Bacilli bacterium]